MNKHRISVSKIKYKYGNFILFGVLFVNLILMILKRYVYIECFTICLVAIILLLKNKISLIDFYLKQIIIGILSIIITLGLVCTFLYDTHNFLYLAKGYIECVILNSSEYTLLTVSTADDNDGRYSIKKSTQMISRNNARDFYERYMMKNEYKPFSDNVYYIELEKGGGIFVVINKYSEFTIFKFLVNS